ncbi:MAG: undecaprenyl-diphosphate phosphatase [Victivallaceae bacterium]|nr:undecaprenyl-diphosphate phosphatase [Victivallaceae bacterium]MDD4180254.1 undecaprenyl-diphosphate phosphatase [Victivallaceae bacterium]
MNSNSLTEIIIMAIFQGIAEFLPISSSGHLAVLAKLSGSTPENAINTSIALHAGTLVSIVVFYFRSLLELLNREGMRIVTLIVVGSIPAGIVGVTVKLLKLDDLLTLQMLIVGAGFLITAMLLRFGLKETVENGTKLEAMTFKQSLIIGTAQAVAIIPGISRSGSTIATALRLGINKADCAKFSFYLAIPAIGGATFLQILSELKKTKIDQTALLNPTLLIGFFISAVVGLAALNLLIRMLKSGKLEYFSRYLLVIGIAVVSWGLIDLFLKWR